MKNEDILKVLFSILNRSFDDVIWYVGNQNNDVLDVKFGTLSVLSKSIIRAKKEFMKTNDSVLEQIQRREKIQIQIDIYNKNDDVVDIANSVSMEIETIRAKKEFDKNGICVVKKSNIRNIPFLNNKNWEYRASFDIDIEYINNFSVAMEYIETATIIKA